MLVLKLCKRSDIASANGVALGKCETLADVCESMNDAEPPKILKYKRDGKYHRVIARVYES